MTTEPPESTAGDLRDVLGMGASQSTPRLAPGQMIDAYRIVEEIGAGGMGRVYRAHDQRLGRDIAIKLHARARAGDELVREAAALARLAHPNVVTVYEVGTWANHPWVAMELVRGGTARAWCKTRSRDEILALYRAAGAGLAAAHAAGLVHRDFKPDNVLVGSDGRARVADFGLAVDQHAVDDAVQGTPGYMAPEQRAGTAVDARADQYAFAVSLWEALAGGHPSTRKREVTVSPKFVNAALERAMEDDPAKRFPSMEALLAAIAPRRSRAWLIAGLGAMVGLGAIALSMRSEEVVVDCSPPMLDEWAAARPRFSNQRLVAATDAWALRWQTGSRSACEAHEARTQSTAIYDHRVACLERGRTSLRAMLSLVEQVPPAKAVELANGLPHVEDCADVAMLVGGPTPPRDFAGMATAARAEAWIARARTQRIAGDAKGGMQSARTAIAFADANKLASASARARIELAASTHASGTLQGVRETFEAAVKFAAEAHDDALAARAWINLIDAIGIRQLKPDEAEQLLLVAEAAITRAGNPPILVGYLAGARADLALAHDRFAEAIPLFEQVIAAISALYGDDVDQTRWRNRLAQALLNIGRFEQARVQLDRAAEIIERAYGPLHPNLGVVLTTRGQVESMAGDYAAAIGFYERALAIKTAAVGPEHAAVAPTLINLAYAQADAGSVDKALVTAQRGTAIAERTLPPTHPNLGLALQLRGRLEAETGAWPAAEVTLDRAVEILTKSNNNSAFNHALSARSSVHLHAGRIAQARADAAKAVAVAETAIGPSFELATALAAHAEVDRVAGDLPAARAKYERAIEMVRKRSGAQHPALKKFIDAAAKLR